MTRTDVHRPSAIQPDDYEFVGCEMIKIEGLGDCQAQIGERMAIVAHMKRTGGTYSKHAHGGNCHICGNANAIYTMLFYHEKTNSYVRTGSDCADKLDCGADAFRRVSLVRDGLAAARKAKAGKAKALAILTDAGLEAAFVVYNDEPNGKREENIIRDIVGKLVQYGSLSEAQLAFVRRLLDGIENRAEIEAKRAAETEAAAPVPVSDKRMSLRGTILSIRRDEYGTKMLFRHVDGYKLWGKLPADLAGVTNGTEVEFSAKVTVSDRDPKFGFFSRPTKAKRA